MPDLSSPNVPPLRARVHQQLSVAECLQIPVSALHFRPLQAGDYEEMVALHTEWFPVSYDENFYTKSVQGEIFTLVATYRREAALEGRAGLGVVASMVGDASEEHMLGIITMSTSCEHHCEDIGPVLGADCATICRKIGSAKEALNHADDASNHTGCLAYILTLGVADGFRRRGLARELLRRLLEHVDRHLPHVQAIYLHVVTYNDAAIRLYEAMRFCQVGHFMSFYYLHGKPYDSFLYAMYLHSGRPPLKWRIKNFFGLGLASSWKEWVVSAWCSLWRNNEALTDKPLGPDVP